MTPEDIARVALNYWSRDDAVVAVAIALAESGGRPDAAGDHLSIFDLGYRRYAERWACNGYTSWGLWQIHLPAHRDRLRALVGSDNPCDWAGWLSDPDNNARVAYQISQDSLVATGSRWRPWTTYNTGAYLSYIDAAAFAVDAVYYGPLPPGTPPQEKEPLEYAQDAPHPAEIKAMNNMMGAHAYFFELFDPSFFGG